MAGKKKAKTYEGKSLRPGGGGRFEKLKDQLAQRGAQNPEALAAWIGRQKYGSKKMAKMAATGRKRTAKKQTKTG